MTRATYLIRTMGGKKYDIYRPTEMTDPTTGADIVEYAFYKKVLGYIQPCDAVDGVKGIVLRDTEGGDESIAGYVIFHNEPLQNHDRLQYEGKTFELRTVENWQSSFMKFWKSYLIELPNEE